MSNMSMPYPSRFHTLALDIGGVFFLGKAAPPFFERWGAHLQMDARTLQQTLWYGPDIEAANIGTITAENYFDRSSTRMKLPAATIQAIIEEAYASDLNVDLIAYVRQVKPRIRIAALTNNWSFGRRLIEQHGFLDLFDLIISSAEVGVKKPNPGIYQALLDAIGDDPSGIIFVDDTLENLEVAQTFGIHTVHFQTTEQTIAELEGLNRVTYI
jgi:putative hydrolase of the HAD superfamily